jgi:UbiD family decarboxylase
MGTVAEEMKREVKKDVTSLRSALDWLASQGDVLETNVEVDPDLEITGVQKHLDGGPVLLFNNVKGKPHARAITNLLADMNVVDKLFGVTSPKERTRKIARAMTHPMEPVKVPRSQAPCQEEVITDDLDVNKYIAAIRHTALETELTIGSGISCVVGE